MSWLCSSVAVVSGHWWWGLVPRHWNWDPPGWAWRCWSLIFPASQSSLAEDHPWGTSCDRQHRRPAKSDVHSVWSYIRTASQLPQDYDAHIPVHPKGSSHVGPRWTKAKVANIEEPAYNVKKCTDTCYCCSAATSDIIMFSTVHWPFTVRCAIFHTHIVKCCGF